MAKGNSTKFLEARWEVVPRGDGSAVVYTEAEAGGGDAGRVVGTYPVRAVADAVVKAHNDALEAQRPYNAMIRVAFGSRAEETLVSSRLTTRQRGTVLVDAARLRV